MNAQLYLANRPVDFWRLMGEPQPSDAEWAAATQAAAEILPAAARGADVDSVLENTLGEGQFGPDHWQLSPARRTYYKVKPFIPRALSRRLRQLQLTAIDAGSSLGWPIEPRYAEFQWAVIQHLLEGPGPEELPFIHFWPGGRRFALVLTHDIETAEGQAHVQRLAELEADCGFRSSFNFVAERYRLDRPLIDSLRAGGFEIGIHGLKHDGKLFNSRVEFMRHAARINEHLERLEAVGFRAPLTHRQPEWMQALAIEYDLSFFDTDPYEPIPGGTMSIWPFEIGRFVELPYTLVQDYTLTSVLGETTPRIWLEKLDFIEAYYGLALVNSHPDYLQEPSNWRIYEEFLQAVRRRAGPYWHALPREVARWWRSRRSAATVDGLSGGLLGTISLDRGDGNSQISISPPAETAAHPAEER